MTLYMYEQLEYPMRHRIILPLQVKIGLLVANEISLVLQMVIHFHST
jgi:hypothetical protein